MDKEWNDFIMDEMKKEYMLNLRAFIAQERLSKQIFPPANNTFQSFAHCPYDRLKVVIIGQDPYCTPSTADGLAFSTTDKKMPIALDFIFEEVWADYWNGKGKVQRSIWKSVFQTNSLMEWAIQGALLLNSSLTVESGKPNSHKGKGWEIFIGNCIKWLCETYPYPIVFMLWGKEAIDLKPHITENHHVLMAAHPVAEEHNNNAGFLGCKHFTKANKLILQRKVPLNKTHYILPINWRTT